MSSGREGTQGRFSILALMVAPLALMLVVGGLVGHAGFGDGRAAVPQLPTGIGIPQFALPPLAEDGAGLADTDLRGKVSILNFWASWCVPCREELPLLQGLSARSGVAVLGINSSDRPAAARQFLKAAGNPFTRVGVDADGSLAKALGVYGLPATFVIDAQGRVAHALIGPLEQRALDRDILPLIARLAQTP